MNRYAGHLECRILDALDALEAWRDSCDAPQTTGILRDAIGVVRDARRALVPCATPVEPLDPTPAGEPPNARRAMVALELATATAWALVATLMGAADAPQPPPAADTVRIQAVHGSLRSALCVLAPLGQGTPPTDGDSVSPVEAIARMIGLGTQMAAAVGRHDDADAVDKFLEQTDPLLRTARKTTAKAVADLYTGNDSMRYALWLADVVLSRLLNEPRTDPRILGVTKVRQQVWACLGVAEPVRGALAPWASADPPAAADLPQPCTVAYRVGDVGRNIALLEQYVPVVPEMIAALRANTGLLRQAWALLATTGASRAVREVSRARAALERCASALDGAEDACA